MSDRLTLVVFKDHLSSRTLTVRLAWLRGFALVLLSVIGLAIIAGALFFNAYRKTITSSSPGSALKMEEMEKELSETTAAYESLKRQAITAVSGKSSGLAGGSSSFTALPADSILEPVPSPDTLAIRLDALTAEWKNNHLQIRSAIEYIREDGGNQQGHFIILARGPQLVLGYPEGIFNSVGATTLIKPADGEFFSVSRYRELKADFGPFAHRDDVQSIEIFIFDPRKRLIYLNQINLAAQPLKVKAPKKIEPAKPVPTPVSKPEVIPEVIPEITPTVKPSSEAEVE